MSQRVLDLHASHRRAALGVGAGGLDGQSSLGAILSRNNEVELVVLHAVRVGVELFVVSVVRNVDEAIRDSLIRSADDVDILGIAVRSNVINDRASGEGRDFVDALISLVAVDALAVLRADKEQGLGVNLDTVGQDAITSIKLRAVGNGELGGDLGHGNSAVSQSLNPHQVAVNDVFAASSSGRSLDVVRQRVDLRVNGHIEVVIAEAHDGVRRSIGVVKERSTALAARFAEVDAGDSDSVVGAVNVLNISGDLRGGNVVLHAGDDTIGEDGSNLNVADQVAILVLEPSVGTNVLLSFVVVERNSIVISSAADSVLVGVVPDDGLSAFEGLSLADDLAVDGVRSHSNSASGLVSALSGESVDQNEVALGIAEAGAAVVEGELRVDRAISSSSVIDIERDLGSGLQMASCVERGLNNSVDLCEEGVDHDDAVLIDLSQTALRTNLGEGVGRLNFVGAFSTVDEQLVDLLGLQASSGRNVALGDSGGVGLDELVGIDILTDGGSALVPSVGRTAPLVLRRNQSQTEVLGEQLMRVVVLRAVRGNVDSSSSNSGVADGPVAVLGVPNEVGDGLAIDNLLSLEGVEHDLGSLVTGQGGVGVEVVETLHQALNLGKLEGVDSPRGADETFFVLVVAEDDEDHLQELGALDVRLGNEGGGILTSDDACTVAVGNIALAPAALHVSEGVRGGVEAGDVGGLVGKDRNDLGRLFTGDVLGRLEALVSRIAFQNVDVGKNVDSFNVLYVLRISEVRGLCAGDGREAEKGRDGENQSKNLFEVLHNEFLLFYFTGRKRPVMMDSS